MSVGNRVSYWRRTAWGRASSGRRWTMVLLFALAVAGLVVGSTVWRPAAVVGSASIIVFALVVVSA